MCRRVINKNSQNNIRGRLTQPSEQTQTRQQIKSDCMRIASLKYNHKSRGKLKLNKSMQHIWAELR